MFKEFVQGFKDAESMLEKSNKTTAETSVQLSNAPAEIKNEIHYRLAWLGYISPEYKTVPGRSPIFSKFHAAEQRIPDFLLDTVGKYGDSIVGIFPEYFHQSEEIGYLAFTNSSAASLAAQNLTRKIESIFESEQEKWGYLYFEVELSRCSGNLTAPAMSVKQEILLNKGFDSLKQNQEIHDFSNDYAC